MLSDSRREESFVTHQRQQIRCPWSQSERIVVPSYMQILLIDAKVLDQEPIANFNSFDSWRKVNRRVIDLCPCTANELDLTIGNESPERLFQFLSDILIVPPHFKESHFRPVELVLFILAQLSYDFGQNVRDPCIICFFCWAESTDFKRCMGQIMQLYCLSSPFTFRRCFYCCQTGE